MKAIATALVSAQKAFGPALKTSTNPHFRSKYADLSACVEAVIDALNEAGIAMIQVTHPDESGVTVETLFLHESGEQLSSGRLHVPAAKNDPQGYGSALTYARRYSLMAACGIAPEDDDGNAASKPRMAATKTEAKAASVDTADFSEQFQNYSKKIDDAEKLGQLLSIGQELAGLKLPDDEIEELRRLFTNRKASLKVAA